MIRRLGSPSGPSTLITSAPQSPKTTAAAGAAMNELISSTRNPAIGRPGSVIDQVPENSFARLRARASGVRQGRWLRCFGTRGALGEIIVASRKKPNFIVVLIDDLRFDELGICGHAFMRTPHID